MASPSADTQRCPSEAQVVSSLLRTEYWTETIRTCSTYSSPKTSVQQTSKFDDLDMSEGGTRGQTGDAPDELACAAALHGCAGALVSLALRTARAERVDLAWAPRARYRGEKWAQQTSMNRVEAVVRLPEGILAREAVQIA